MRNLPCRAQAENAAWLEAILTVTDLVCWSKLICFADHPSLAKCEIAAFRYRVLQVAAQLVRSSRQLHLRIDRHWRWATAIASASHGYAPRSPDTGQTRSSTRIPEPRPPARQPDPHHARHHR